MRVLIAGIGLAGAEIAAIGYILVVAWRMGYKRGLGVGLDEGYKAGRARETAWWAEIDHQVEKCRKSTIQSQSGEK